MSEYTVVDSNGRIASFQGSLIAKETSQRISSVGGERWFELAIYARLDAGFVAVIVRHSTHAGEAVQTIWEFVDQTHDIENFFFVFEPSEVLDAKSHKGWSSTERNSLLNSLLRVYEVQVDRILKKFGSYCDSIATGVHPDATIRIS